jgi:hypothetical protein
MIETVILYFRTLRHLRIEQIAFLFVRRVLRIPRTVKQPVACKASATSAAECMMPASSTIWLGELRFNFLNREKIFGAQIDWKSRDESRLWQYNLHYFDWFRQPNCDFETSKRHILDWIKGNPPFFGVGWEPYPTSLRLVNWIGQLSRVDPKTIEQVIVDSVALQAEWLKRSLEYQLGANHLFVNLKALMFCRAFFDCSVGRGILTAIRRRFLKEINEQFLKDGGHFERSPMYHALLTQDLLELFSLFKNNSVLFDSGLHDCVEDAAKRAIRFCMIMQSPDDVPFFFNDSVAGIAPSTRELISFASLIGLVAEEDEAAIESVFSLEDSGYFGAKTYDGMIVIDCGEMGPPHQLGHAHCDLLSYELYLRGRRIVTNSGNYDYEIGPMRFYSRSTRAHNTVVVDRVDQAEMWGAFRVGRRAKPLVCEFGKIDSGLEFKGSHDGYMRLAGGVVHSRIVRISKEFCVSVLDEITGAGVHMVESFIHLASGLCVDEAEEGVEVRDEIGSLLALIMFEQGCKCMVVESARYPEFGVKSSGVTIVLSVSGGLPLRLGYEIVGRDSGISARRVTGP